MQKNLLLVPYLREPERVTCIEDNDLKPAPLAMSECRVHDIFSELLRTALRYERILLITIAVGSAAGKSDDPHLVGEVLQHECGEM
jgi:hypothetical protein